MRARATVLGWSCLVILLFVGDTSKAAAASISLDNLPQLARVASLPVQESFVNTLFFSRDGDTLVSGDRNGELSLWSVGSWDRRIVVPGRSTLAADEMAGIAFFGTLAQMPDEETLVEAYGSEGMVSGYSRDGDEVLSFSYGARAYALAVSPDGRYLAVSGVRNVVLIYDLLMRRVETEISTDHEYILNLAFSPDARTLLGACERPNNVLKTWDVGTWQETSSSAPTADRIDYHDVLYTPDGREIAMAVRLGTSAGAEIVFLDVATWERTREFADHTRAPYQLAFSPDGTLLASAGDDGTVRLWNLTANAQARVLSVGGEVGAVAFSPDGSMLALSIWERGVEIWAVAP